MGPITLFTTTVKLKHTHRVEFDISLLRTTHHEIIGPEFRIPYVVSKSAFVSHVVRIKK